MSGKTILLLCDLLECFQQELSKLYIEHCFVST